MRLRTPSFARIRLTWWPAVFSLITNGNLHRFVNIYVDDEDVRFAGGLEAPVKENSQVTILPAVAGG